MDDGISSLRCSLLALTHDECARDLSNRRKKLSLPWQVHCGIRLLAIAPPVAPESL